MDSLQEIWEAVLALMGQDMSSTAVQTWFGDARPVEFENGRLVLHTPSEFKKNLVMEKYSDLLARGFEQMSLRLKDALERNSGKERRWG